VPRLWREMTTLRTQSNDSEATVAHPLYDQPGPSPPSIDPNSLQPPIGCAGGRAATSNDSPRHGANNTVDIPGVSSTGYDAGVVTYTLRRITMADYFVTWCVTYQPTYPGMSHPPVCALQQRHWRVVADSRQRIQSAAVDGGSTAPTMVPITSPPYANDMLWDPANTATGPGGPATITFTR
jgi:hypothetical protein